MSSTTNEAFSHDGNIVSGDWIYKGSAFRSRMPGPDKRAEFLNANALRQLLPLASSAGEVSQGSDSDKQALKLIQRLLKDEDRLKQLDRKVAVHRAKMAQSDGALLAQGEEPNASDIKGPSEDARRKKKRPRSAIGRSDGRGEKGAGPRPTTADIAPRDILAEIGMTPTEFDIIDKIFHRVDVESAKVQTALCDTLRTYDEGGSGVVSADEVELAVEQTEITVDSLALDAALEASAISMTDHRRDNMGAGQRPPVRHEAVAQRVRVAVRFDEVARQMGVEHERIATESLAAKERAAALRSELDLPMHTGTGMPAGLNLPLQHTIPVVNSTKRTERQQQPHQQQRVPQQLSLDGMSFIGSGVGSGSLPPVKATGRAVARKHMTSSQSSNPKKLGVTRQTPRSLRPGATTDIGELRHELAMAEEGLKELQEAVKQDVQWVQNNCPSEGLSLRAQLFCKQWAAEKLKLVWGGSELEKIRRGFRQWKSILQLHYNMGRLNLYLRFTACRKVLLCMQGVMYRMMEHVLFGWVAEVRRQKREESDAAATEVQRFVRRFTASRRVAQVRREFAASVLISFARTCAALDRVDKARRKQLQGVAASCIQYNWRNHRAIKAGKILVQKEREKQAAAKIQRNYRNHLAINAAKVMIRRERRRQAAEKMNRVGRGLVGRQRVRDIRHRIALDNAAKLIQKNYRNHRAINAAKIIIQKEKEYQASVHVNRVVRGFSSRRRVKHIREERATRLLQRVGRGLNGRRRVNQLRNSNMVSKARHEAAAKIQSAARMRTGRLVVESKREAKRVSDARRSVATTKIQNAQRAKVARARVAQKRYEKMVKEEDAAARFKRREKAAKRIQRVGRGAIGRRRFLLKKKAKAAEEARRNDAAVIIQGMVRAKDGRRAFEVRREKKEREDAEAGRFSDEKASQIQALYRGWKARVYVKERLEAKNDAEKAKALKEKEKARLKAQKEAQFRAAEKKRIAEEQTAAIIKIQSLARRIRAKLVVSEKRALKVEKDRITRAEVAKKQFAALCLQRAVRSFLARCRRAKKKAEIAQLKAQGGAAADEIKAMEMAMKSELFGEAMADAGAANRQAHANKVLEDNLTNEQKQEKYAKELSIGVHKEQRHAATKIQARARGMSSRARVQMMRQALAEEQVLKAKDAAATIIENVARQTIARRKVERLKNNIVMNRKKLKELDECFESVQQEANFLSAIAKVKVAIQTQKELKTLWNMFNTDINDQKKSLEVRQREERSMLLKKQTEEGIRDGPLAESEVEEQIEDFSNQKENLRLQIEKEMAARATEQAKIEREGEKAARKAATDACAKLEGSRKQLEEVTKKVKTMTDSVLASTPSEQLEVGKDLEISSPNALAKLKEQLVSQEELKKALTIDAATLKRVHDRKSQTSVIKIQCLVRCNRAKRQVAKKRGSVQENIGSSRRSRGRSRERPRSRSRGRRRAGDSVDSLGSDASSRSSDWTSSDSEDEEERKRRRERRRKKRKRHAERRKLRKLQRAQEKRDREGLGSVSELPPVQIREDEIPDLASDAKNMELYGNADDTHEARQLYSRMWARTGEEKQRKESYMAKRAASPPKMSRDDDSDADSSSDDNSAFASRAFANMGSTGQIVPLNKEMIRQEAESAMTDKLGSLLDEKMRSFEDQKRELLTLQESLQAQLQHIQGLGSAIVPAAQSASTKNETTVLQSGSAVRSRLMDDSSVNASEVSGPSISESQDIVPALPNEWKPYYDENTGSTYYFNEATNETSWSAPNRNYESDGYDTTASQGTAIDYDTDTNYEAWNGYDVGGDGSEWIEQWDDQAQARYWFNTVTLEASWTQPEEMNGNAAADEWMSHIDAETGKEYWVNQLTNETTWKSPY